MSWMRDTASRAGRQQQGLALAAGLLALLLLWGATFTSPWHALEFKTFDVFTALAAPRRSGLPLVILAIDEPTFQELNQPWPFPRSLHARLLRRLHADGAAAVGFDVVFADPSTEEEDAALQQAIAEAAPVVLAAAREKVESGNATLWTDVPPLPRFLEAGAQAGDVGVQPDDDFVVRRASLHPDSFAARLASRVRGGLPPPAAAPEFLAYRGPRGTFDTRSYYQALEPGLLPPGFFRDKIVLVGRSARTVPELQHAQADLFNSPFGALGGDRLFPGVELQATLLDNLLAGDGLRAAHGGWTAALVLPLLPLLVWGGQRLHPGSLAAIAGAAVLVQGVVAWVLFAHARVWLPPLLPMVSALVLYGTTVVVGHAAVRRRARQTRAMLSQYVPAAVVSRLIAHPELLRLGGEAREVTVMFTDLAGFTTLSEQLSAEQTVEVLTGYFSAMTPIIHRRGGTVDKFIGDAVMAFWGAPLDDPRHAENAVRAAVEMQQAMHGLVADLGKRGLPPIHMRIGLHTGRVVVGNVGSDQRFSYTAIGDAVNLAARLEGANKAFGTQILLSGATAAQLPADVALRPLDDVIVKGKSEPVRVYTPCDDIQVCALGAAVLDAFHARQWAQADQLLQALLALRPHDPAAVHLRERVAVARSLPPGAPWSPAVALDKL
ncbi:adenylate/guanylate cyclase with Chase sensor [Acidovorax delafieldii 2AN]|uniref:Adenylate/guanylate cyclase with Chase sensor n=1 Tax=Acidovorax delafieldii 2AN TaxID=573060 RepID=C5T8G2_ACIDE|nr:adenylate/guanylate cyclase domain-containing protein [Acidovorax delafieldii]EER59231.1 adenylate/guanylate cyclase with Chase sensor [Acidovorax delafieldii 2AN]